VIGRGKIARTLGADSKSYKPFVLSRTLHGFRRLPRL